MDLTSGILLGFQVALQPYNLLYCFIGVCVGTLIGVLPGIGPVGAMSILLPITFGLPPATSIIMLAGIFYGAMYGGSTTSIMVNIPGEPSSVITCLDGYQMARKGRLGPALGMSAMGSFIGGTLSLVGLLFLVFPLAQAALKFGPPEIFAIICGSMVFLLYLSKGSAGKAFVMILIGLLLGTVGIDRITGISRFDFGSPYLLDGIDFIPLAMGLFGISEVLMNLEEEMERTVFTSKLSHLLPNREDWRRSLGPILRGTVIGFFGGILPGAGPVTATFLSYTIEKKLSKDPGRFGQGAIEGVAGPETANNAATGGSFVPALALGIPPNVIMAFMLGALIIHGVSPGPLLISQHPQIFWGVMASMYVGNCMLLLLNLPLIGFWVKLLRIPYRLLMPMVLLFCIIGSYSINNNSLDVIVMVVFGVVGYILRKCDYEAAPLMVAYILGPMLERAFRQSLVISDGSLSIFVERRIAAVILVISALLLIHAGYSSYRRARMGTAAKSPVGGDGGSL